MRTVTTATRFSELGDSTIDAVALHAATICSTLLVHDAGGTTRKHRFADVPTTTKTRTLRMLLYQPLAPRERRQRIDRQSARSAVFLRFATSAEVGGADSYAAQSPLTFQGRATASPIGKRSTEDSFAGFGKLGWKRTNKIATCKLLFELLPALRRLAFIDDKRPAAYGIGQHTHTVIGQDDSHRALTAGCAS